LLKLFIILISFITFALMACDPRSQEKNTAESAWQTAETADQSEEAVN